MAGRQVRFAQFRFDARTRELFRRGRRVRLGEKPSRVLEALLARPGDLVARAELRRLLWDEHTFVDFDNNLNSAVASLREALGDSAQAPAFIETLPRLGYRFIGAIDADTGEPPPQAGPAGTAVAATAAGAPGRVDAKVWRRRAARRLTAAALSRRA
jgi:DNA-binding winged helix-turn-helix (wHTH) protein